MLVYCESITFSVYVIGTQFYSYVIEKRYGPKLDFV